MWCPRCDQGHIVKAKIKKTGETIFICEECDATWTDFNAIEKSSFQDFSSYMELKNLPPLWDELAVEKKANRQCPSRS